MNGWMDTIHKYQVKCNVIFAPIVLRNICRDTDRAPCILNISDACLTFRAFFSRGFISLGDRVSLNMKMKRDRPAENPAPNFWLPGQKASQYSDRTIHVMLGIQTM